MDSLWCIYKRIPGLGELGQSGPQWRRVKSEHVNDHLLKEITRLPTHSDRVREALTRPAAALTAKEQRHPFDGVNLDGKALCLFHVDSQMGSSRAAEEDMAVPMSSGQEWLPNLWHSLRPGVSWMSFSSKVFLVWSWCSTSRWDSPAKFLLLFFGKSPPDSTLSVFFLHNTSKGSPVCVIMLSQMGKLKHKKDEKAYLRWPSKSSTERVTSDSSDTSMLLLSTRHQP